MTTYRSPLLRRAALALLLASAGLAAPTAALAGGHAVAAPLVLPLSHRTVPATPGTSALGRACINEGGGIVTEDPAGACGAVFRNITPPLPPAFVSSLLYSAKASMTNLGSGNKKLDAEVVNLGIAGVVAEVKDPITFAPELTPDLIDVNITLDMAVQADADATSLAETSFLSDLTGSGKLFDIRLVASHGGAPTLQLAVSPYLIAQGWNQATLELDLNAALAAGGGGTLTGFMLPVMTFIQPANTELNLFADGLAQVDTVPEPGTCALLLIGALGAWLPGVRSRYSAAGAGSGRSASGAGRYSGSRPGRNSHPLPA